EATGLSRTNLAALANGDGLRGELCRRLLSALRAHSRPVKPADLGVIGKEHLAARLQALGCAMKTFDYRKAVGETDGIPWLIGPRFAARPKAKGRRLVVGVNWSPGIVNPFRELGRFGQSLDSFLEKQRVGRSEPVALVLHQACSRPEYTDRGKSAVVVGGVAGSHPDEEQ